MDLRASGSLSLCEPFQSGFSIFYNSVILQDLIPMDFQNQMF